MKKNEKNKYKKKNLCYNYIKEIDIFMDKKLEEMH